MNRNDIAIMIYKIFHKNPGCDYCGYFSHREKDCHHEKNLEQRDAGDFFYEGVINKKVHTKWNKNRKCSRYCFASNQTTPKKYTIVPSEYKRLIKIVKKWKH